MKRNSCEYDVAGGVTDTEADALLKTVWQFAADAEAWINARYPHLARFRERSLNAWQGIPDRRISRSVEAVG